MVHQYSLQRRPCRYQLCEKLVSAIFATMSYASFCAHDTDHRLWNIVWTWSLSGIPPLSAGLLLLQHCHLWKLFSKSVSSGLFISHISSSSSSTLHRHFLYHRHRNPYHHLHYPDSCKYFAFYRAKLTLTTACPRPNPGSRQFLRTWAGQRSWIHSGSDQ